MTPANAAVQLREDEAFTLLRSAGDGNRESVLIVTPVGDRPSQASLARLQRAYLLRDEIDPSWGTRPIALVVHDGRPALLLQDPGGITLEALLGQLESADFLRLSIGIAESLSRLHDSGLIHCDLKPSNILVETGAGRAWLTGLCLASRATKDSTRVEPAKLSGTLAYMAPEQTGHVNRAVDLRSDLYSLGVTLYQLATGSLPFVATEPMDWVHSHLAKRPVPLLQRGSRLPATVESIVLKLLEKDPEDRYQSAAGLAFDLRKALAAYETSGAVPWFLLGARDTPDHLLNTPNFHGRKAELQELSLALDQARQTGAAAWVLVRGYSGIGKSSFVHEFLRTRGATEALVACGKFDELEGEIPYATLCQVIKQLTWSVLAKSAAELSEWRVALTGALKPNAALLTQLVPELELVIGEQPPLSSLPLDESRNRAFATFSRFLRAFAAERRPLLIFLDDLQWLDGATSAVIEHVMLDPELKHLFLIGAYRDHVVTDEHLLRRTTRALRDAGCAVQELALPPLSLSDVSQIVANSLHTSVSAVTALAQVVEEKTGGNPFFVGQFLAALVEDGLLTFDHRLRSWGWDLDGIVARGYTENLAELVLGRLARLPHVTQEALKVLACVGGNTQNHVLEALLHDSTHFMRETLQPAVDARVVTRSNDGYAFPHDRLQETAYSLIPAAERAMLHLQLGRALRAQMEQPSADSLFEVVRHLNRGMHLIEEETERTELAELNFALAKRSRAPAADASALVHLDTAWQLLPLNRWQDLADLAFDIALARAECEFLAGDRARAQLQLAELAGRTADLVRLGAVVCAQIALHMTLGDANQAVAVGVAYLRDVGVPWRGDSHDARSQYERLLAAVRVSGVAAIAELPRMSSVVVQATMDVCATLVSPAYFVDRNLYALLILYMATLSLEHGNSDGSCLAYALLCIVLGPIFGNHALGLEFGQLSARLVEAGLTRFAARVYLPFGVIIVPRTTGLHGGHAWIISAFEAAKKSGDLIYAVYARTYAVSSLLACGAPLHEAEREAEDGLAYSKRSQFSMLAGWISVQLALIRDLRGVGAGLGSWRDLSQGEEEQEVSLANAPTRFYFYVRKLQACYYGGDFEAARAVEQQARRLEWSSPMFPEEVDLWLFGALAQASWASGETAASALGIVLEYEGKLNAWALRCPETFANKAALVRAERLRLQGRILEADQQYEQATQLAREHDFIHEEALTHELAARFYAGRGLISVSQAKWSSARSCYLKWGALGKVVLLDQGANATDRPLGSLLPSAVEGSLEQLELAAVVAALRAVSSSLELDTLIDGLMRSAVQHAAADRACLILLSGDLRVRAEATSQDGSIRVQPIDSAVMPDILPASVLRFVLRTSERVLIEDDQIPPPFVDEPYLRERNVRSLMCMPIVVRAKPIGLLYLENSLTTRAFRPRDLAILELVASQAAISIENARLYAGIHDAQQRMSQAERVSRTGSFSWRPVSKDMSWSEEMFRIYELESPPSFEAMRGRTHPEDLALFDAMLESSQNCDGKPFEYRLTLADGSIKYLSVIASRIADNSSPICAGTVRDVTESKRAEEALQRTQAALADMTRFASLGEMAAAIAHEVNQPLAAIGLNASTCLRWLDAKQFNPQEAREAALRITRDANRASAVVQRLRALFSKTEGLKCPVDLADAIGEVLTLLRGRIRSMGTTLHVDTSSELPRALGDRVQLQQVIMNLVTNALESMQDTSQDSRELSIRTLLGSEGRLRCEIRDTGPGIPEAEQARIFEPFFSTKHEGMGIGLSIGTNILESHGGQLRVQSNTDGPGVTFFFELPCAHPG